ncbi:MAG: hypothetical protein ACREQM_06245, partial [Candidatus Dormibacteraceae bacterium]
MSAPDPRNPYPAPPTWAPEGDWRPRQAPPPSGGGGGGTGRRVRWGGGIGGALLAIVAWGKYALLLGLKIPALLTLGSMALSFAAYAVFYGPWFAVGFVVMIFCHEMGHVVEIRRQGMRASAPLFIPFFGAAIF